MQAVLVLSPPTFFSWDGIKAVEAFKKADMKEYQKNMTKVIKWTRNACLQMKCKFMAEPTLPSPLFKFWLHSLIISSNILDIVNFCELLFMLWNQGGSSAWSLQKRGWGGNGRSDRVHVEVWTTLQQAYLRLLHFKVRNWNRWSWKLECKPTIYWDYRRNGTKISRGELRTFWRQSVGNEFFFSLMQNIM